MILANTEIHKAIDAGELVIQPEPLPRKPESGQYCPYGTHSVDLRLHNEIRVPLAGPFAYDLEHEGDAGLAHALARNSKTLVLTTEQPYVLKPRTFVLGRTLEKIKLPLSLSARIEGKSSRARCGILVHFTAPTVHPGFQGSLTLEMMNLGPADFMLRPNMPIAQLIVEQVFGTAFKNPSQFQDQSTPEGIPDKDS